MSRIQLGVLPCVRPAAFVHWTNGQCSPPTMSRWCSNQLSYAPRVVSIYILCSHVIASNIHVPHPAWRPGYKINPFILSFGPHIVRSNLLQANLVTFALLRLSTGQTVSAHRPPCQGAMMLA